MLYSVAIVAPHLSVFIRNLVLLIHDVIYSFQWFKTQDENFGFSILLLTHFRFKEIQIDFWSFQGHGYSKPKEIHDWSNSLLTIHKGISGAFLYWRVYADRVYLV